ncbi:MAG: transcriptional repressor [Phyllobacteriaceae bacterium]|nr:transcriptional repressor [Phyllobacteriaceae bacterium]
MRSPTRRRERVAAAPVAPVLADRLRAHGLRPTRQRVDLLHVLQAKGDRHVSAEVVYDEALRSGVSVSLATVYNTLKQFTEAGLLAELAVSGAKSFFDTRVDRHHHFYVEGEGAMIDLDLDDVRIERLPEPPAGMEVVGYDVVVRLRRKA